MVTRKILVIDDDKAQAAALAKKLEDVIPDSELMHACTEESILNMVENKFFNLAVLDIRMDNFDFDGIQIAKRILEANPFARIVFVSRYIPEYMEQLAPMLRHGNVLGFSDKKADYNAWGEELRRFIMPYYESLDADPQPVNAALINLYAELKDMDDILKKGARFEGFISLLFQSIGYREVIKRTRDKSDNEVDLIIRNDIEDPFLSKFGKYFLVECKNHIEAIGKNDFIIFREKLVNTNGLAQLGFLITTSSFKRTTYMEALRSSAGDKKVIFLDNAIIMQLLQSGNRLEELKRVIDSQVKDN